MTVRELIENLESYEDKEQEVKIDYSDRIDEICQVRNNPDTFICIWCE